jgi:hypothetical protein
MEKKKSLSMVLLVEVDIVNLQALCQPVLRDLLAVHDSNRLKVQWNSLKF